MHSKTSSHTTFQNAALFFLRIVVGVIFIYHGYAKLGLWSAAPEGMPAGMMIVMKILSIAEPLGGIALLLGLLTCWASLGLSIIMVGAIVMKMTVMGIGFAGMQVTGWEFDLMILAGTIALMAFGPGCWALDGLFRKNK